MADLSLPETGRAKSRQYANGSAVWNPSDLPDRVFRLRSGCVHIVMLNAEGQEHLYRAVAPGELFGEMCFCSHRHEPHGTMARSLGRSEVWATSYDDFRRGIREDLSLVDSVIQTFCGRVAEAEQRVKISPATMPGNVSRGCCCTSPGRRPWPARSNERRPFLW